MSGTTPSRSSTPTGSSSRSSKLPTTRLHYGITGSPSSGASPQVKARIQELRRAKEAAAAAAAAKTSADATDDIDDSASQRRSSSLTVSTNDGDGSRPTSRASSRPLASPSPSEVTVELEMKGLDQAINAAKTSGRLNIASRSLAEIPLQVYQELVPRGSPYHPSNSKGTFAKIAEKMQEVSLSSALPPHASSSPAVTKDSDGPKWWEYADLTVIKASSNELSCLPEEIAGFEALQFLDMHNNAIASPLPASLGTLSHLTSLNLSGNKLTEWPIEIMALVHLQELDLSLNKLKELWPRDSWRDQVKERLKTVRKGAKKRPTMNGNNGFLDPDTSIDSIDSTSTVPDDNDATDFWTTFPSSPIKPSGPAAYARTPDTTDYTAPLPKLRTLNLRGNSFRASALSSERVERLPPTLVTIDFADNGLNGPLPMQLFGVLSNLQELNLANNGLDDGFFADHALHSSHTQDFPALERLDLSRNAIDSLEQLENALSAPHARKISYSGISSVSLKKYLALVTEPSEASRLPGLTVNVADNFLREEGPRRKTMRKQAGSIAAVETPNRQEMAGNPLAGGSETTSASERIRGMMSDLDACKAVLAAKLRDTASVTESDLADWQVAMRNLAARLGKARGGPAQSAETLRAGSMMQATPPNMMRQPVSPRKSVLTPSRPSKIAAEEQKDASSTSWSARRRKLQESTYDWAPL